MYEKQKKNVKKSAKQIVENLNDIAKPKGKIGKGYLAKGKAVVDVDLKGAEASNVGKKLGSYIEDQVANVKKSSKKVDVDIE